MALAVGDAALEVQPPKGASGRAAREAGSLLRLAGTFLCPGRRPDERSGDGQAVEREPQSTGVDQSGLAQGAQCLQHPIRTRAHRGAQVHKINDLIVLAPDEETSEQAAGQAAWNHAFSVTCSVESLSSF